MMLHLIAHIAEEKKKKSENWKVQPQKSIVSQILFSPIISSLATNCSIRISKEKNLL
jgi:hypothetical protein